MIVKIVPLRDTSEELRGFKVFVAGEAFEVKRVYINDTLEEEPGYDARFIEAADVEVYGSDEALVYTEWYVEPGGQG